MEIKISGTPEEIAALVQTLGASEKPVSIGTPQIASGTIPVELLKRKEVSPLDVPFLLAKKIKLLCAERNLSFADLEQACGLGSRTIYKWDKSSPSVDKIQRVASFFGVSIDSLLSEQEEEVAEDKSAGSIPALSSKEVVRKDGNQIKNLPR